MTDGLLWVLIALLWLVIGWLPTRLMKHHYITEFNNWERRDEFFALGLALGGPLLATGTALAWFGMTLGKPKGWKW